MAMSEHGKIRELLTLAAAGVLTTAEEKQVAEHVRSCIACSHELDAWRSIATDLYRLPAPQPSSRLVQATLARAEAKLAEQAEGECNRRLMIFVVAFAWLLMVASWPVFHFVSGHFGSLIGPQFGRTWISLAAFSALAWLAGGVVAVTLAIRQGRERRLA
jgi:anti-sigma factor RsiW